MAKSGYAIVLAAPAAVDLRRLTASQRAAVKAAIERHLRHQPERTSRSSIKRLRGRLRPQYRLRVGEIRVFYDVSLGLVEILAIVAKDDVARWLAEAGEET